MLKIPHNFVYMKKLGYIVIAMCSVPQSCPTLRDCMECSLPWNFPGKNSGMGCLVLLQGIFPIWIKSAFVSCVSCIGKWIIYCCAT